LRGRMRRPRSVLRCAPALPLVCCIPDGYHLAIFNIYRYIDDRKIDKPSQLSARLSSLDDTILSRGLSRVKSRGSAWPRGSTPPATELSAPHRTSARAASQGEGLRGQEVRRSGGQEVRRSGGQEVERGQIEVVRKSKVPGDERADHHGPCFVFVKLAGRQVQARRPARPASRSLAPYRALLALPTCACRYGLLGARLACWEPACWEPASG
jgi:hypothetical protein